MVLTSNHYYVTDTTGHVDLTINSDFYGETAKNWTMGYAAVDEGVGRSLTDAQLSEAYELIRDNDPEKPVYSVDARENQYAQLIRNVDIVAVDPYPFGMYDAMT